MYIRKLKKEEILGMQKLVPDEWHLDLEGLIRRNYHKDFFYPVAAFEGEEVVAAGNLFLFSKSAWLGQILVDKGFRRRGLGTMIMETLISYARDEGVESINLVATKQGEFLYKRLGFKSDGYYHFYKGTYNGEIWAAIRPLEDRDLQAALEMDYKVTAETRQTMLRGYLLSGYKYVDDLEQMKGIYLPDFGQGLILALDANAGIELIKFKHFKNEALTVIPDKNEEGMAFLNQAGFKRVDQGARMYLGTYSPWLPELVFGRGTAYTG